MQLDRNINKNGNGKYALINLRTNKIEWGESGTEEEFFVIKLRDRYAQGALNKYAEDVKELDEEFAAQVQELANRSGEDSSYCKNPD